MGESWAVDRRTVVKGTGLAALATLVPWSWTPPASAAPTADRVLATNLQIPWGLVFVGSTALVGERDTGNVYRVPSTGGTSLVGTFTTSKKLMGMVLSPGFATDRLIYAYLQTATDNRVVRFTYDGTSLGALTPVFTGIPVGTDHPGGAIAFGPDGYLYVGVGDLGTPTLAQDLTSLGGKILRLNADGTVPADNPYNSAVWTYGHRNVEGFAFDGTILYATEFGDSTTDELNRIVRGGDYGWPNVEGGDGSGPVQDPIATWTPTSSCSPSGLAVVGGQAFIGALAGTALFQFDLASTSPTSWTRYLFGTFGRIRTVALAPDGSLWLTTSNHGTAYDAAGYDQVVRVLPGVANGAAPTNVSGTAVSTSSATLSWSPPTSGGTVTGYVVTRDAGTSGGTSYSTTVSATTRSFTFNRLTAGSTYLLTVAAVTASGTGPTAGVDVTIPGGSTLPGAPTSVTGAVVSSTSASVSWQPPASDGNSAVTGYRVTRDGGSGYTTTVSATTRTFTFTNLTAGQTYTLTVEAINAVGTGDAARVTVTPGGSTLPTAPTSVSTAVVSATSASLSWQPPTSTGGSAVTGYQVTRDGGSGYTTTVSATTRSFTFARLTSGQTYTFTVAAITAAGTGPGASATVVPAGVPGAPTIGTAVAGTTGGAVTATAQWTPPSSTGGSAITGYYVYALRMSSSGSVLATTTSALQAATARSLQMTLSPAGNYRFTVTAVNAAGTGAQSARSNQVAAR